MRGEIKLPITDAASQLTVTVKLTGLKVWRVRLKVAGWPMLLATKIAGVGLKVE